jgi:hypothetical protein
MLKHDSKPSFVRLTRVNGRAAASPFGNGHFNTTPARVGRRVYPSIAPLLSLNCQVAIAVSPHGMHI